MGRRVRHAFSRVVAIFRDADADAADRAMPAAAGHVQLVDQEQQHVELADGAEARRHFPQPPAKLASFLGVELEHRQQLAEPARGDACAVEPTHVALLHGVQLAGELVEAFL